MLIANTPNAVLTIMQLLSDGVNVESEEAVSFSRYHFRPQINNWNQPAPEMTP